MSFQQRALWLFVSAIAGWALLCALTLIHDVSSSPIGFWRSANHPWRTIGLGLNILSRMYVLVFIVFAVPACYSARLPALLWKRSLIGAILFACGGIACALYFHGVLGALTFRPQDMEFGVWLFGIIMKPVLSLSALLFPVGALAFALLPCRSVAAQGHLTNR
jgi:hypothetical protein